MNTIDRQRAEERTIEIKNYGITLGDRALIVAIIGVVVSLVLALIAGEMYDTGFSFPVLIGGCIAVVIIYVELNEKSMLFIALGLDSEENLAMIDCLDSIEGIAQTLKEEAAKIGQTTDDYLTVIESAMQTPEEESAEGGPTAQPVQVMQNNPPRKSAVDNTEPRRRRRPDAAAHQ